MSTDISEGGSPIYVLDKFQELYAKAIEQEKTLETFEAIHLFSTSVDILRKRLDAAEVLMEIYYDRHKADSLVTFCNKTYKIAEEASYRLNAILESARPEITKMKILMEEGEHEESESMSGQ